MINMRLKQSVDYIKTLGALNPAEKVFLFFIINIMGENGDNFIRATAEDLADNMGLARRTIQRVSYNLRDRGIITIKLHSSVNVYRLVNRLE